MLLPRFSLWGVPLLALLVSGPGSRAWADPPQIEQVRVGLPAGSGGKESGRVRPGTWTPVYLKVKSSREGNPRDAYRILVQATDPEDALYTYPVTVPALAPGQDFLGLGYIRPGQDRNDVQVLLQTQDGKTLQTVRGSDSGGETVAPSALLVLAVGARLNNLKQALYQPVKGDQQANPPALPPLPGIPPGKLRAGGLRPALPPEIDANAKDEEEPEDQGGRRFAYIESVAQMPDQWFGYDGADVLVLATGNQTFLTALLEDQTGRREALLEWVRRGGRVLISVGSNHQTVARLLSDKLPLLRSDIQGTVRLPDATNLLNWLHPRDPGWKPMEVANLKPSPQVQVLLQEKVGGGDHPLLLRDSFGLGEVVLVGFDLDVAPFTEWSEDRRRILWDKLLTELMQRSPREFKAVDPVLQAQQTHPELHVLLQRGLESFYDVPVIHFGWVTLFILLYILIVGPLDYFVLKKLFKRLELTWITFPALVLLVSVLAYWIAYQSKGDDVRINQIDLVDYDLHGNQAYGNSWFTLFSPRIGRYTIGLESAAPQWLGARDGKAPPFPGTALGTQHIGERFQRVGSQGLFPQPYAYAADAGGISGVPIPVWATRCFVASWHEPLDPDKPAIDADIERSRVGKHLPLGTITNNLPVELQGITLFYQGRWYTLGDLEPGESKRIDPLFEGGANGKERSEWMSNDSKVLQPNLILPAGGKGKAARLDTALDSSHYLLKALLFHAETGNERGNSGLRRFDQSWRIMPQKDTGQFRSEIVLVARTQPQGGRAEKLTADNSTPTRLWLGELPGAGKRPALPGRMWQETYVRAYIPVK